MGDGPLREIIEELSSSCGIVDKVTFMEYQTDTLSSMKKADILVLSPSKVGMSNVLLEAMSVALPVLASCVGSAI
jgi:glycosyltransferase involved in cell wall biosynthesis